MGNKTILVVDDEAEQRDLVCEILQPKAYTVLTASDYDDALAIQQKHLGEIDLLLIDVSLPGRNGYDLFKALLAIEPHLRVLYVSGHAGAELCRFFGMPLTDLHFLQKPLQSAELLQSVKSVLQTACP